MISDSTQYKQLQVRYQVRFNNRIVNRLVSKNDIILHDLNTNKIPSLQTNVKKFENCNVK